MRFLVHVWNEWNGTDVKIDYWEKLLNKGIDRKKFVTSLKGLWSGAAYKTFRTAWVFPSFDPLVSQHICMMFVC